MTRTNAGLAQSFVRRLRGLSVKYEDTVNTEGNTSNNMELFLFVLLKLDLCDKNNLQIN